MQDSIISVKLRRSDHIAPTNLKSRELSSVEVQQSSEREEIVANLVNILTSWL